MRVIEITKKFYKYQKQRFPLSVLSLSLVPAILSSLTVTQTKPNALLIIAALMGAISYLLHIRIIDEQRDFQHDNTYHIDRPVQTGLITLKELRYIDILAISLLMLIALGRGLWAFIFVLIMLSYTYLAGKEFFIGEKIRKRFLIYNAVNLVQMLLMQLFVYILFLKYLSFNKLIFAHFLFTSLGTIIFEFVRKLKTPGEDGSGEDTYTWYLGFKKSIIVFQALILLNSILFLLVIKQGYPHQLLASIISISAVLSSVIWGYIYWVRKSNLINQIMQLNFLLSYGLFNLLLYLLRT